MSPLQAALRYAASGLSVIQLHSIQESGECTCRAKDCTRQGKHPVTAGWQKQATTDPERITVLWTKRPWANVGILTGNGLCVIDIDGKEGSGEFQVIRAGRELPLTTEAVTGGGGKHYFFRVPAVRKIRNGKLAPHIDIRGDGGQVVVEPSRHRSGKEYSFLQLPEQGIAEIPEWLAERLAGCGLLQEPSQEAPRSLCVELKRPREAQGPSPSPTSTERKGDASWIACRSCLDEVERQELLAEITKRFPILSVGQRNDRMHRAAASLASKGVQASDILDVMTHWLQHFEGNYSTPIIEATSCLESCLKSLGNAITSGKFKPALANHRQMRMEMNLPAEFRMLLNARIAPAPAPSCHSPLIGGDNSHPHGEQLCESKNETAFVEAMIIMYLYEPTRDDNGDVKVTNEDLKRLLQSRWGITADNQQIARLKYKFISRPKEGAATRFELFTEVRKGFRKSGERVPSLFRPSPALVAFLAARINPVT